MVMESSTFAWHPGPYTNLNTTLLKARPLNYDGIQAENHKL